MARGRACSIMLSTWLLSLLVSLVSAIPYEQQQQPLAVEGSRDDELSGASSTPKFHGRFLHITGMCSTPAKLDRDERFLTVSDFHPDRHYKVGSSISDGSCHHGKGPAGYFGQEGSDCDAPIPLLDETFRWIEENLKDKIDFVIWTGDSARHDNDERIPRTDDEIVELNEFMAQKWTSLFGTRKSSTKPKSIPQLSVPVVPTLGNNDITPHNIFRAGPNDWTKKFADIWRHFIPEDQRHTFVEGGWFTTEVIPGKLAVISLNTMYFYESNSAVDGCKAKSEPGYEHMEWLRVQLELLRDRGMKAILMGHVAPAHSKEKRNWDETCWQKYTLWVDRYRDTVVGSLYGHMNIDHFILQDSHDIDIEAAQTEKTSNETVSATSKDEYLVSLRKQWSDLPSPPSAFFESLATVEDSSEVDTAKKGKKKKKEKKRRKYLKKIGGEWAERYSVSLVSPSLVPNFFPTLRVVEYNTSGLATMSQEDLSSDEESISEPVEPVPPVEIEKNKKKKNKKKSDFKMPDPPSPAAPPGPAYSNQAFTFLSYTQYYANLTRINEEAITNKGHPHINFEIEYATNDDDVYQMKDLTVRSFLELAVRIGGEGELSKKSADSDLETSKKHNNKKKKLNHTWRTFLDRAFVGFIDVDDLDLDKKELA